MFSDPVSFNGATRVEVIAVLANCGRDTDRARRALVTWIRHKQDKGRTTEHILAKLRDIESKFIRDATLHSAFRDARAETCLPRAPSLPLPSFIKTASEVLDSGPSTSNSAGRSSISSFPEFPTSLTQQASPPLSPWRLSGDSSHMSEVLNISPTQSRRISPQSILRVPSTRSPQIQIPRDRPIYHGPNSPITSSPEESEIHLRYRSMSDSAKRTTRSNGLITPVSISASPPDIPPPPSRHQNMDRRRRSYHNPTRTPPSMRVQIPHSRSQRSVLGSPHTSSDEGDYYPKSYRPLSQQTGHMSPSRRRLTPPRSTPPDVPLPPIPSDDQGPDSDSSISKKSMRAELPPTPVRSLASNPATPIRPLPIQPIPSPVPGSDESEAADTIGDESLRQHWQGSNGELPIDFVDRQDSPVYELHDGHSNTSCISPPPPYADQLSTYLGAEVPTTGESLDRVVRNCGDSREVRLVVSKCIGFHRGYEPPYWQTRLQACGLDAEAVRHLVDEMCKQVDWASSFRRSD